MARLLLISFPLTFLFLLPILGEHFNFDVPLRGVLTIPATGLSYMAVFFHELGHTVTWWSFGYPSLPTFDFSHGGGMTYTEDRSWPLQYAMWAVMGLGIAVLWQQERPAFAGLLCLALAINLSLAFSDYHEVAGVVMGHGGEILIACFCILRSLTGAIEDGDRVTERWLGMIFGLFTLGLNAVLSYGLVTSDVARMAYAMQKGEEVQGDFMRAAEMLNIRVETLARISLGTIGMAFCLTLLFAWHFRERDESVR